MDIAATLNRLEALAAGPKPWLATITLPNGTERTLRQPREDMARRWATRMNSKYGCPFFVAYSPE